VREEHQRRREEAQEIEIVFPGVKGTGGVHGRLLNPDGSSRGKRMNIAGHYCRVGAGSGPPCLVASARFPGPAQQASGRPTPISPFVHLNGKKVRQADGRSSPLVADPGSRLARRCLTHYCMHEQYQTERT